MLLDEEQKIAGPGNCISDPPGGTMWRCICVLSNPALVFLALCLPAAAQQTSAQQYDLLIRGGRVVDGTGNPSYSADIGITAGRIGAMGRLTGAAAKRVVDAAGLTRPGFIDIHNHSDNTVLMDGNAQSMVRQGVTSMIFGEGGSAAPDKDGFADFQSYFARLGKRGVSTNIGSYVGSSQVWTQVRGPKAGPHAG